MTGVRAAAAQQAGPGSIFGPEYRVLTLGVISVMTIVAFEAMGVITAMPTAARELDGLSLYAWGSTAVTAAGLYAMAAAGGWADRRGPVPPLAAGLVAFVLGTLVCGFAPTMPVLLLGRAFQGLGFGAAIVALYVVIGRAYPEHLRPRVFTALSGSWVVPGIVGPLVAGLITDAFGWRWVFFGVLLLLIPVGAVLIPRLQAMHVEPDPDADPAPGRKRLALLAAVGVVLLQVSGQRLDVWSLVLAPVGTCTDGLRRSPVAARRNAASSTRIANGGVDPRRLRRIILCSRVVCSAHAGQRTWAVFGLRWRIPVRRRYRLVPRAAGSRGDPR